MRCGVVAVEGWWEAIRGEVSRTKAGYKAAAAPTKGGGVRSFKPDYGRLSVGDFGEEVGDGVEIGAGGVRQRGLVVEA